MVITKVKDLMIYLSMLLCLYACQSNVVEESSSEGDSALSLSAKPFFFEVDEQGVFKKKTNRYQIDVRVPLTNNQLAAQQIRDFISQKITDFIMFTEGESGSDYFGHHLQIDWRETESDYLYTFIFDGYEETGGALRNPFIKTFTYSKMNDQPVYLRNVLRSPQSLNYLSKLATDYFEFKLSSNFDKSWIAEKWINWQNWFASNNRITFEFPAYQVAEYADGTRKFPLTIHQLNKHLFNLDYFNFGETDYGVQDEQGHGPDSGSEEEALSIAYRLIKNTELYQQDGFDLKITNIRRVESLPSAYQMDYSFRHFGDQASFYQGSLRVVEGRPHWLPKQIEIIDSEMVLVSILKQSTPEVFSKETKIAELLDKHQHVQVHNLLQQRYNLPTDVMEALWSELSSLSTVGEWVDQLSVSNNLMRR